MRFLIMKQLVDAVCSICNYVNIVYLYFHEENRVLIPEDKLPHSSRKLTGFLRSATNSHPTITERSLGFYHASNFHRPSKGYLHVHHPSKDYVINSVTWSII